MAEPRRLVLKPLPGEYAVSRLDGSAAAPPWADGPGFVSITRTGPELSIVCLAGRVPEGAAGRRGYACLEVEGPFALSEIGVLAAIAGPLAEARVSILAISTFDTDYLLVDSADLPRASEALRLAGHEVRR